MDFSHDFLAVHPHRKTLREMAKELRATEQSPMTWDELAHENSCLKEEMVAVSEWAAVLFHENEELRENLGGKR